MTERISIVIGLMLTAACSVSLAIYIWLKKSSSKAAVILMICVSAIAVYSFGYGMELLSDTLKEAMFWVRFQHLGIDLIAPTWLLFALANTGFEKFITKKWLIILGILPLILFLSAETLGWLNLFHHNPRMDTSGAFPIFTYDRNIFNYISAAFYSICLLISTMLFALMLFRSSKSSRGQAIIYLLGTIPPWLGLISYSFGSIYDATPLTLGIASIILVIGFVQLQILDIMPLARDLVFEKMCTGVMILDTNNRIMDYNPALTSVFHHLDLHAKKKSVFEVFSAYPTLLKTIRDHSEERIEMMLENNGEKSYYRISSNAMYTKRRKLIGSIVSFYEYTNEKCLLEKLEKLAALDGLTGIYNRPYFDQYATKEINRINRYGGVISMIYLDIDRFKSINDTYGHPAGDLVLEKVAETLSNNIRESDILARFGGEEFVILLPQTDVLAARALGERLRVALENLALKFDDQEIPVRASFGITGLTSGSKLGLEMIYKLADKAMYHSKEQGGNRVCLCLHTDIDEPVFID
jgi:diguanylate cyclase (GGDEF)-like protein